MQNTYVELQEQRKLLSKCIDYMKTASRKLGQAEYQYRLALTKSMLTLKIAGYEGEEGKTEPCAWTMVGEIARGLPEVAELRLKRDLLRGDLEAAQQKVMQVKIEINLLQKETEMIAKGE
jgi:hypothetical protein